MGEIFLLKSKWREACDAFENAAEAFADKPDKLKRIEFWLGIGYGQLGNADRQIAAFRRALEIDPKYSPARLALADALKNAGKGGDALKEAAGAAENSRSPEALLTLIGMQIEKNRRLPEGERHWEEVDKLLDRAGNTFPGLARITLLRCEC